MAIPQAIQLKLNLKLNQVCYILAVNIIACVHDLYTSHYILVVYENKG